MSDWLASSTSWMISCSWICSASTRPENGTPTTCFMMPLYRLGWPAGRSCCQRSLSGPSIAKGGRSCFCWKRSWKTSGSLRVIRAPDLALTDHISIPSVNEQDSLIEPEKETHLSTPFSITNGPTLSAICISPNGSFSAQRRKKAGMSSSTGGPSM